MEDQELIPMEIDDTKEIGLGGILLGVLIVGGGSAAISHYVTKRQYDKKFEGMQQQIEEIAKKQEGA